jgi:PAS domain S-box-containing protein
LETVANRISSSNTTSKPDLQRFLAQSDMLQSLFNGGSFVVDAQGIVVASVPESSQRVGNNYIEREHIVNALKFGKTTISEALVGIVLKKPLVSMAAPIRNAQGVVTGAVVGVTNLGETNFLNTLVANPCGKTGGYLLVDKQHRRIVTATDKSRILQASPPPGVNPRIDGYLQGYEGIDVFVNRLGEEVLQTNQALTSVPWFIAAQLPTREAFAAIEILQRRTMMVATVVTLLAAALVLWLLRRQFAPLNAAIDVLDRLDAEEKFPPDLIVTRDDEVGQLVTAFNQMLMKLRQRDGELRESELRYRTLIEWTPQAIGVHRDGKVVYVNLAAVKLFGARSDEELLGKQVIDLIHPEFKKMAVERAKHTLEKQEVSPTSEEKYLKLDGTPIDVIVQSRSIVYDGQMAVQVAMQDVTQSKRHQQQLEHLLGEQQAIIDSELVGMLRIRDRRVCWATSGCQKMLGYGPGEFIGTSVRQYFPSEESYHAFGETAYPYLVAGQIFQTEVELVRKDGFKVWIDVSGRLLDSGAGETLWMFVDVTQRHCIDQKVRQLSRAVEQAPIAIVITDLQGSIEYVNPSFSEVTGYTSDEVLGCNPRILQSGETMAQTYVELWQTLKADQVWQGELHNRKKSGEMLIEYTVIAPVFDDHGLASHYVALQQDVTQRKRDELVLKSSLNEKIALLHEVHHRVKNNLQVITSMLRLELRRTTDLRTIHVLQDMNGRVHAMALLHETLYRAGNFSSVDLAAYLRQLATQLFRVQAGQGVAVQLALELEPCVVTMDQATTCGLLVNELMSNALKHGFPDGRSGSVAVHSAPATQAGRWALTVQDTGVGLPPDFDQRCSQSMGMQLSSDLARQLGSTLQKCTGPGGCFTVTFMLDSRSTSAASLVDPTIV